MPIPSNQARRRLFGIVAVLLAALPGCGQSAGSHGGELDSGAIALRISERLNAARAEHGLPPLRLRPDLSRFAERRAHETAAKGDIGTAASSNHQASIKGLRAEGYEPHLVSEVYAQVSRHLY